MVGRGDGNRVNVLVFQQFADVLNAFRPGFAFLLHSGLSAGNGVQVGIADGNDVHVRLVHIPFEMIHATPIDADQGDADAVIGSKRASAAAAGAGRNFPDGGSCPTGSAASRDCSKKRRRVIESMLTPRFLSSR